MRLSLGTQIRVLFASIAVGFGLCLFLTLRILTTREAHQSIASESSAVHSALQSFVRGRGSLQSKLTKYLATTPRVAMLTQADDHSAADALPEVRSSAGVDSLLLLNANGHLMASSGLLDPASTLTAVKSLIDHAQAGTGDQSITVADGNPMLVSAEPLKIGDYVHGALVTFVRMDSSMASEIGKSVRGDIAFFSNGKVLGSSLALEGVHLKEQVDMQLIRVHGVDYYAQWSLMPEADTRDRVGVFTIKSVAEATSAYRQLTSAFGVVLALITITALLAGTLFTRYLTRPLDAVVHAARVLQKGEWPERFETRRKDEVGLLQQVFDDMSGSIQASQAKLLSMIDKDPLTELLNHRNFKQRSEQECQRAAHSGEPLSIVLIDIDRFSDFNDAHGHADGDFLLIAVAQAVKEVVPSYAVLARYGADLFAVLLPQTTSEECAELLTPLLKACRAAGSTVSIGTAQMHLHSKDLGGLILAAELALSRATQLGGDRAETFDAVRGEDGSADPYQVSRFLEDSSFATIQALAAAVDAKDAYTKGHSLRVAEMSRDLCAYIGGSQKEIDQIYRAGTLHDVGKIGVPDAILKKPARLEDNERLEMEMHPVLGEIIVRKVPQLEDLLPGVRHHHERFDGKGYPDGLAGESIPKMARIIAVCDTYDAMTSDRPYRKGMGVEIALAEIRKGAGVQFDPALSLAFCQMIQERSAEAA